MRRNCYNCTSSTRGLSRRRIASAALSRVDLALLLQEVVEQEMVSAHFHSLEPLRLPWAGLRWPCCDRVNALQWPRVYSVWREVAKRNNTVPDSA